jgi:3'-phosphoadenosine 5'-phosphosulfate sulfotransferase (PAPS reductase)/FAD synthetase
MVMTPQLTDYDWIVVNTSAGKDSQSMTEVICRAARKLGVIDRLVMVHADLGRMEWPGTRELAEYHAACRGVRFEVVKRTQDLLSHIEVRGMFPDSGNRFCTSDHKRDQVAPLFTRLVRETGDVARPVRILNCIGLRADESPARSKRVPFLRDARASNGKRHAVPALSVPALSVQLKIR